MTTLVNTISRSNVISGAMDDDYSVEGGGPRAMVQNRQTVLNAAAMQAVNATPVVLVPAPSGTSGIVVISARVRKAADAYGGNNVLRLRYGNATGDVVATIPATVFAAAGTQDVWASLAQPDQAFPEVDTALVAHSGGAYTGSGGDVTIDVKYIVVENA